MKAAAILGLAGLVGLTSAQIPRDYDNNDYYVLHLDRDVQPDAVAERLGLRHQGQLGTLDDHYIFSASKQTHDIVDTQLQERKRRKRDSAGYDVLDGVRLSQKQEPKMRLHKRIIPPPLPGNIGPRLDVPRANQQPQQWAIEKQEKFMKILSIADPIFHEQWHLFNPIQTGHDVNVTDLWLEGITGQNATVAIVDDGLDMHSLDLKDNYYAEGSWDFNDHDPEPAPVLSDDRHGTRCAGEVSAVRNNVCGIGVAYDSKIAGIRILSKPISDMDEADALMYKNQHNQIYSCSWGPPDDGRSMEAPGVLIRRAMLKSIQEGRNGLGTIYVFASGNGAASGDNCNFDGYTNSIYSITVGAVDRAGNHPYYSEHCSAQLVVTYSSGSGDSIHTTDVGENNCATGHGGTSAAAPLAAGIFALVMQVRPELTWRDLQYIAMETAVKVEDKDADWQKTATGKHFSHTFGYGKIDSYNLVELAKTWEKVKPQAWFFSPWLHVKKAIPEGEDGLAVTFEVTEDMLKEANLERLEHVTVTMNVEHTRRGDLSVDLISPQKVISHISTARKLDNHRGGYDDWTFMSVAHWGEDGVGTWTVIIRDNNKNEHQGKFIDWHLKLWGVSIDPEKATLLPLPTEDDDKNHDQIVETQTIPAATTSLKPPSSTHDHIDGNPTDHIHRPTKPGSKPTPTQDESAASTPADQEAATSSPSSHWISWLPSFGASKKAQVWIYGAVCLIAAFCGGLGIYFFVARRRRLRNASSNNYEFELVDEDDGDGMDDGAEKGLVSGKKGRRTRGGELYDAFADGSDDDDEFDAYRDRSASRLAGVDDVDDEPQKVRDEEQHVIGEESDDDDDDESYGRGEAKPLGGRSS